MGKYREEDCSYCTLFNAAYLDRGLAMLRSLSRVSGDIRIYVLTMDEETFCVLQDLKLKKVRLIRHDDFATKELLSVRKERTLSEYCWTCTAALIQYVLTYHSEKICTYVDSDLYFYQNPFCLIEELEKAGGSVQIVEHRFGKGVFAEHMLRYSGRFCVQFNTFDNTEESMRILSEWAGQCLEYCSSVQDGDRLGDQKYLEEWPQKYGCVHILQHEGGGMAPWNIHLYRGREDAAGKCRIENKYSRECADLIFYHFHGLQMLGDGKADMNIFTRNLGIQKELARKLYVPYVRELYQTRTDLMEAYPYLQRYFKQSFPVGVTQKGKRRLRMNELAEKIYCRLRDIVLKSRKKRDFLFVGDTDGTNGDED